MTITTCTRRLEFDMGHRLQRHESKCSRIHGHRYAVELTCEAALDAVGRVIDFGKIKEVVGGWIDAELDHRLMLEQDDPICAMIVNGLAAESDDVPEEMWPVGVPFSPTAENLARFIAEEAAALLDENAPGVRLVHVRLYETPNGWADVHVPPEGWSKP